MPQLALYQPEIPQNVGSLMRLCASLDVYLHVIEPLGFVWTDRHLQRAAMDYRALCMHERHVDWDAFKAHTASRLVLVTPHASCSLWDFSFTHHDVLIVGRESSGFPEHILAAHSDHVKIPMKPPCRSLNVAMAASLVLGEALRQTTYHHQG